MDHSKPEKNLQKLEWETPRIESREVFEKTALACSGVFNNSLYNFKSTFESCGYNDS
jgi:hypothetical protein